MDINSGWMIRAARAALDLNVKDFARIAHVSTQTVTRLEGMEEFEPREDARKVRGSVLPETVAKIAAGFREVGLALDGRGERLTLTRMPEAVENYRRSQRRSAKRRK